MVLERVIAAPIDLVWRAWSDPNALPQWWGPDGFSCRTTRIDLREGGEWVFDMIGPDGTVYPNHHKIVRFDQEGGIRYTLHWGENGPKHAEAVVTFKPLGNTTKVTMAMEFATQQEHDDAIQYNAIELGLQTLGKLEALVAA